MGLKAGSSVPDGGWSFAAMVCGGTKSTDGGTILASQREADARRWKAFERSPSEL